MTRSPARPAGRTETPKGRSWHARVIVLGPLTVVALATAVGAEVDFLAPSWLAALAWTIAASLARALCRGLRHRDWSAFRDREPPENDGEMDEWAARTGRYTWLGDLEDRLRDDDRLR